MYEYNMLALRNVFLFQGSWNFVFDIWMRSFWIQSSKEFLLLFKILSWTGWECYLNYFGVLCVVLLDEDYSKPVCILVCTHACVHSVTTYNRSNEIRYTFFAKVFIKKITSPVTDCCSIMNIHCFFGQIKNENVLKI